MNDQNWRDFDPTWLVEFAEYIYPEERWLHEAIKKCSRCRVEYDTTFYFIERGDGEFARNIELWSPSVGEVILDLLDDGRIGSMEIRRGASVDTTTETLKAKSVIQKVLQSAES